MKRQEYEKLCYRGLPSSAPAYEKGCGAKTLLQARTVRIVNEIRRNLDQIHAYLKQIILQIEFRGMNTGYIFGYSSLSVQRMEMLYLKSFYKRGEYAYYAYRNYKTEEKDKEAVRHLVEIVSENNRSS